MRQTDEVTCLTRSRRSSENLVGSHHSSSTVVLEKNLILGSLHRSKPNIASRCLRTHNSSTTKLYSLLGVPPTLSSIDSELPFWSHFATREHPDIVLLLGDTPQFRNTPTLCCNSHERKVHSSPLCISHFCTNILKSFHLLRSTSNHFSNFKSGPWFEKLILIILH